jgi:hypothetical protein
MSSSPSTWTTVRPESDLKDSPFRFCYKVRTGREVRVSRPALAKRSLLGGLRMTNSRHIPNPAIGHARPPANKGG